MAETRALKCTSCGHVIGRWVSGLTMEQVKHNFSGQSCDYHHGNAPHDVVELIERGAEKRECAEELQEIIDMPAGDPSRIALIRALAAKWKEGR